MNQEAFKIIEPHLDYINGTPWLLWNLMDVNLMPEQCQTVVQAEALIKIVAAHKNGEFNTNCENCGMSTDNGKLCRHCSNPENYK